MPAILTEADFWSHTQRTAGGCREWLGNNGRHVQLTYAPLRGQEIYAHRIAWTLVNGPIPPGLSVLHSCDNPPCCEPTHLFLGTQADNMADMARKNRHPSRQSLDYLPRGESHGRSKLNDELVREIRQRLQVESGASIARSLGVCTATIYGIRNGRVWSHVK